jgi:hypothetical protein
VLYVSHMAGKRKQEVRERVTHGHTATAKTPHRAQAYPMTPSTRDAKKHANARERLERDRLQPQQAAQALEQALGALGLPDGLVAEIEGRLRSQQKLLGTMCGVMFPLLFDCRRGVALPPPMVVAESWSSDAKLMGHVAATDQGTFLVEGKSTYVFALPDGRQVKGGDLQHQRAAAPAGVEAAQLD